VVYHSGDCHEIRLGGVITESKDALVYLGFHKSQWDGAKHLEHRLQKTRKAAYTVQGYFHRLPHLPIKHKLTIAQACVESTYLYGMEAVPKARRTPCVKAMDIIRRKLLR